MPLASCEASMIQFPRAFVASRFCVHELPATHTKLTLLRFAQEPEEAANGENVDDEESNDSKSSPDPIEAAVLIPALAEKLSALRAEGVLLPAEFELLKAQLKTNKMSRFLCNI
eukprot:1996121-Prymnesium_polylepis.1